MPAYTLVQHDGRHCVARIASQSRIAMKIVLSTLVALSVLASFAGLSGAADVRISYDSNGSPVLDAN